MLGHGDRHQDIGTDTESDYSLLPAAISDSGCERELNEDRYAAIDSPSGVTWIVCDGMGGATGGELAAQLAIDTMRRDLENQDYRRSEIALRSAVLEANRIIVLRRQNPIFSSMGTTVVAAHIFDNELCVGHVGDSRAYLVREGEIQQLTVDHTYVQGLVDMGQLDPEEALTHPQAHILTRCLGSEPGLEVIFKKFWIWPLAKNEIQDFLLLCSDGLYSLVSDGEIATFISENAPQDACIKLVDLARERGGYDNITLAVIPLEGRLRNERPAENTGKVGAVIAAKTHTGKNRHHNSPTGYFSPLRTILLVFLLSLLSASVTAAIFLLKLSK